MKNNTRRLPSGNIQKSCTYELSDGTKKRVYGTGKNTREAEKALKEKIKAIEREVSTGISYDLGEFTLQEALERCLIRRREEVLPGKERARRPETCMRDEYAVQALLYPLKTLMKKKVSELTSYDILLWKQSADRMRTKRRGLFKADSKNRAFSVLKDVLAAYSQSEGVPDVSMGINGWVRVKKNKTEDDVLTPEEIGRLFDLCKEHEGDFKYDACMFQVITYLRPGELFALKFKDFDKENHILHIRRTVIAHNRISEDNRVKTKDSLRAVLLPQMAEDIILRRIKDKRQDDLVFSYSGDIYDTTTYNKFIKRIMKSLGIEKPLTPHALRRSGITFAAMSGADMYGVAANAGHSDISTTQKYYTAIYESKKKSASNVMEKALLNLQKKDV